MSPIASGPFDALIADNRRAIRDSASSQLAGRNVSPSRISGVVRRSGLFTKSQPNFPFTQVEIALAGPCSGATLGMWRSLVQMSKLHPTPQYVQTVFVRRTRCSRSEE